MTEQGVRKPSDHLYWARTQSTATPVEIKPLDKEAAAALEQAAAAKRGAAWNAASTWEEKDISKWAHELLSETLLPSIAADFELSPAESAKLPAELQDLSLRCSLKVASVTSTTGDVTHVLSRGKQRVVFELALKLLLELEIRQGSELKHILTGTLNITEATNEELDAPKLPAHKLTCEDRSWASFFGLAAVHTWPPVKAALGALVDQAKQKWI